MLQNITMRILTNKYWATGIAVLLVATTLAVPVFITEVYTKRILQLLVLFVGLTLLIYGLHQKHKRGEPINYFVLFFLIAYGIALYLILKR